MMYNNIKIIEITKKKKKKKWNEMDQLSFPIL